MPLTRDAVFGSMKVLFRRLGQRKPLSSVVRDQNVLIKLRPNAMNLLDLVAIGIGGTIGIGIFNLTGRAAARFAGPSVIISLLLGGIIALLSALSFAEMSSMMTTPGSAYTYAYVAAGEYVAFYVSWSFIAFYQLAASTVATSWSRYLVNFIDLISDHNATRYIVQSPVVWSEANDEFQMTGQVINLPAIGISVAITIVLLSGIRTTSRTNMVLVVFKLVVLLIFIFAGSVYVKQENFSPFFPPNTGQSKEFGVTGMLNAASFTFFAYNGFESISPVTNEAKTAAQNVPRAILISTAVTILFYIGIATVMVGLVDYKQLDTISPLTEAIKATSYGLWLLVLLDLGALASLATVALTMLLAQTRIFYVMSHDGLLPKYFAKVNQKRNIPWLNTLICGSVCAVLSGVCPVDIIGEGASFSLTVIYIIVHACVIIMRYTHPTAYRGFRIPLRAFILPGLGLLLCILLLVNTTRGTIIRYVVWMSLGHLYYFLYGYSHSTLGQALVTEINRARNMELDAIHRHESMSTQSSTMHDVIAADNESINEPAETVHET